MGSCLSCGIRSGYETGAFTCLSCIKNAERQAADNQRMQNELLSIERQKLYEQRVFQQRLLEQSISKKTAWDAGYNKLFAEGDIRLDENIYDFNFSSPYITEELIKAYYEGAHAKLHFLIGPYDEEHFDSTLSQVKWIGCDLKDFIIEKSLSIINEFLKNNQASINEEFQKKYAVLKDGSDGRIYTVHVVEYKLKIYIHKDGKLCVEGIALGGFCEHKNISQIFDAYLDLDGIYNKINLNTNQLIIKEIFSKKDQEYFGHKENLLLKDSLSAFFEKGLWGLLMGLVAGSLPGFIFGWNITIVACIVIGGILAVAGFCEVYFGKAR